VNEFALAPVLQLGGLRGDEAGRLVRPWIVRGCDILNWTGTAKKTRSLGLRCAGFSEGGEEMVEVLDELGKLAKERAESLQRTAEVLEGEPDGFVFVAKDLCNFVRFLDLIWSVMQQRFRQGGVPAKRLLQECDLLLELNTGTGQRLELINKSWQERALPGKGGQPLHDEVQIARKMLDSLFKVVHETREWAATPLRITADPDALKRRMSEADEGKAWENLSDVVLRMRQGSSPRQG
jgi:hypothetical protein